MKIHEYQAKAILARHGVPSPRGEVAFTAAEAGEMPEEREDGRKPFQLDQCHALDTTSETVRKWYPKWHRKPKAAGSA